MCVPGARAGVLGDEMKTLPVKPRSSGRAGPVRACVLSAVEIWECMVRDGFVGQSEMGFHNGFPLLSTPRSANAKRGYSSTSVQPVSRGRDLVCISVRFVSHRSDQVRKNPSQVPTTHVSYLMLLIITPRVHSQLAYPGIKARDPCAFRAGRVVP